MHFWAGMSLAIEGSLDCWSLNSFLSTGWTKCSHQNFLPECWLVSWLKIFANLKIWCKWFDTNLIVKFDPSASWILLGPPSNSGAKQLTSWLSCWPDAVMPGFARSPTSLMSKFSPVLFAHLPAHQPLPQGGSRRRGSRGGYSELGGLSRRHWTSINSENAS